MKANEIRNLTLEELNKKEEELKNQLFKLRFQQATSVVDNPVEIRTIKHDIARIKTVIREKELAAAAENK